MYFSLDLRIGCHSSQLDFHLCRNRPALWRQRCLSGSYAVFVAQNIGEAQEYVEGDAAHSGAVLSPGNAGLRNPREVG